MIRMENLPHVLEGKFNGHFSCKRHVRRCRRWKVIIGFPDFSFEESRVDKLFRLLGSERSEGESEKEAW